LERALQIPNPPFSLLSSLVSLVSDARPLDIGDLRGDLTGGVLPLVTLIDDLDGLSLAVAAAR